MSCHPYPSTVHRGLLSHVPGVLRPMIRAGGVEPKSADSETGPILLTTRLRARKKARWQHLGPRRVKCVNNGKGKRGASGHPLAPHGCPEARPHAGHHAAIPAGWPRLMVRPDGATSGKPRDAASPLHLPLERRRSRPCMQAPPASTASPHIASRALHTPLLPTSASAQGPE